MEARTLQLRVEGMTCEHCAAVVERSLLHTTGVRSAVVDLKHHRAVVQYDGQLATPNTIVSAIQEAGYEAQVLEPAGMP